MRTYIRIAILLIFWSTTVNGQQEIGLHLMRHAWQSHATNPAIVQKEKIIRLPGLYNGLVFDGPSYGQLVTKENGDPVIDIDKAIGYLEPQNVIKDDLILETIGLALPFRQHWVLSLGHSIRYHGFFKYPKTLPQVVYQGNAQFIGETVDIGNELQVTGYHTIDLGIAYTWDRLTLGGTVKFLSGFSDATTSPDHRSASLYTDPDIYQITLQGDYILNTTNTIDYNAYDDISYDFNFGQFSKGKFFEGNTGWAFDLGARYQTEKWDVAASVIDIGKINWSSGVTNYVVDGLYEYEGLDFSEALTGGESPDLGQALDTLEQIFKVTETGQAYSNRIPRKVYLSVLYNLNEQIRLGAVFSNEHFRGINSRVVGLGGNLDLASWLNAGIVYAITENSYNNLGVNLTLHLKFLQLFAVTDNFLDIVDPENGKNLSVRIGANLCF